MKKYDTVRPFTIPQLDATIAKIEEGILDWEEGRMTSPDERDHVIEACEVLGIDWHQIDRDTDNPVVEKIANEIFEDAGETITDVRDLATHILMRLYEEVINKKAKQLQVQPTVTLIFRGENGKPASACAFDDKGEVLETVDFNDGIPDWSTAGICDARGGGGQDGFKHLYDALSHAEQNAQMIGWEIKRVAEEV